MFDYLHGWISTYLLVCAGATVLSLLLTAAAIRLLPRLGIMDHPDPRKLHTQPVPRMGGVAVYIAFVTPMLLLGYYDHPQQGVVIGSGIALLIGMVDDVRGVPAVVKLIALFLLTLLIRAFGVVTNLPFPWPGLPHELFNLAVSMLWITGVCSAMNAFDHMDALASGIALIATISYFAVSLQTGQHFWALTSIALFGALLGFLWHNRHPARIFLGDSGSFFLGFSLAAIGIMGGWSDNPLKAAFVPVAILSLPLFDFVYVLAVRSWRGTTTGLRDAITYCGKDHFGHRLLAAGLGQVGAARLSCLLAATVAISALVLRDTEGIEAWLLVMQVVMIYILIAAVMLTVVPHSKE